MTGRSDAVAIRYLVNAWSLQFECVGSCISHCSCLFLLYGSETVIWKEKERAKIMAV